MKSFLKLLVSIAVCEAVGLTSSLFTIAAIETWYKPLNKPSFSPPNWVFGPVWTILYFMMGVSAYIIWEKGLRSKNVRSALTVFLIQLGLNFLWSIFFFGLRQPILGFINIVFLWVMIVISIRKFYPLSKQAAYFLIPYLLWVSFASVLNASIVVLN